MPIVNLISTGSHRPGEPIPNRTIEELAGHLPAEVLEGLQVTERHWIIDPVTGEHRTSNSRMAADAALHALGRAGLEPADVDLVVVSTASPEFHLPAVSSLVLELLGIPEATALDVRSGCAGFVQAMDIARLQLEAGAARRALVIGSEVISPIVHPIYRGKEPGKVRMRDRILAYTFGDGAGAVLLEASDGADDGALPAGAGISGSVLRTVGGLRKPGMKISGGATHAPLHEQQAARRLVDLYVDVVESGRFIPHMLTRSIQELLAATSTAAADVDLIVIPEGNAGYVTGELEAAGLLTEDWMALRDKVYENIGSVGATGSAAVPLALDEAASTGLLSEGDTLMLLAIETSKWTYAGMGLRWHGGAAWAA
ncbi:3-oxoacyl-ACP synthase III family protein [Sinomonas mesophila]|uniref:3-oxoacyl-ACP synthase III family protein n=1 Tax=Sinomonas mesophila TaxID=1531955 RepID=UPI000986E0E7|nr:3-oxoacyl-[acyl-carrier-protein] synthase III C-terminal domain-containing protein [Sinomonas mesophila]